MLRGTAVAIVVGTFIAAGFVGASALRKGGDARAAARADAEAQKAAADSAKRDSLAAQAGTAVTTTTPPDSIAAAAIQPRAVEQPAPPFAPELPYGESALGNGVTAVRSDSDVVVSFDTPASRTRRPDRFEQLVRSTLTSVYGVSVSDLLDRIPTGALGAQGDLITELPRRGMRIPVNAAWMIRLFPETRAGQEGPLVVRYRVRVAPIGGP
jgi:hypothetical protein